MPLAESRTILIILVAMFVSGQLINVSLLFVTSNTPSCHIESSISSLLYYFQ